MLRTTLSFATAVVLPLSLLACGGGGGASTGSAAQQTNQFPNANQYVGTWATDCSTYQVVTAKVSNVSGALKFEIRSDVFAAADCTGPVLATAVGAAPLAAFLSTENALVQLTGTGMASRIDVDKVQLSIGQYQQVVTGATVYSKVSDTGQQQCVDTATGYTCWETSVRPAVSTQGGLYVNGNTLYLMTLATNGLFSVGSIYRRVN